MCESSLKPFYSVEDYLELQSKVDNKIIYHDGEVFAMIGGKVNQSSWFSCCFYKNLSYQIQELYEGIF